MYDNNKTQKSRRRLIKALGGAGGGLLLAKAWQQPVVDSIVVPAHAQLSTFPANAVFGTGAVNVVDAGSPLLDILVPTAYGLPVQTPDSFQVCVTVVNFIATIDVWLCAAGSLAQHAEYNVDVSGPVTNLALPYRSGAGDIFGAISISGQIQHSGGIFTFPGTLSHAGGNSSFTATTGGSCGSIVCACFLADTTVWMADGSYKAIQDVQLGDQVSSHDFATGKRVVSPVTRLYRASADDYLEIDGLRVTRPHPFAVGEDLWKFAGSLQSGDVVYGSNGPLVVGRTRLREVGTDVFNLQVDGTHNYYVGDRRRSYLVHNKA